MAVSMGVSAARGFQSSNSISGTLANIQKQRERMNILQSPDMFAEKVWKLLDDCIATEKDTTWYFIYHPDTHWTSSFRHLLRSRGTQTRRFIGIFHDLNTAILFMQGIRVIDADQNPDEHPEFRLLIPTFYHIVIQSPLNFPSNIEPFKVYGERFDNDYLVYMNLPNVNKSNLINIGNGTTDQDEISSDNESARGSGSPPAIPGSSEDRTTGLHEESGSDNRSYRSGVDDELSKLSIISLAEAARQHKQRFLRHTGDTTDDDLETASITAVVFPLQHDDNVDPSATAEGRRSHCYGHRRKPSQKD
ncbi:hypothetical protein N7486_000620 [Penicillium sp. IBT 16267x]|nr:hypothetical protein N7486_000620 [Penicillium sp. IBT 16267x]